MNTTVMRCLDANLNRASEGLRVLMDVARFHLDAGSIAHELKQIRHQLVTDNGFPETWQSLLVLHRDSTGDVARPDHESSLPPPYRELDSLVTANFRRVEESLRTLEENSRLLDTEVARRFELMRYRIYDLQKELLPYRSAFRCGALMDFELYVVTDSQLSAGRSVTGVVRQAIAGGAGCVQLREKQAPTRDILQQARELRRITRDHGVTLIINDRLDVALECEADGVHLGQDDLPLEAARRWAPPGFLIGISCHNQSEALEAQAGGAGYVNLGPVFPTKTKQVSVQPIGLELIRQLGPQLRVPFTTMGGINSGNVSEVIASGADRVAVVSAVVAAQDVQAATQEMLSLIHQAKQRRQQ